MTKHPKSFGPMRSAAREVSKFGTVIVVVLAVGSWTAGTARGAPACGACAGTTTTMYDDITNPIRPQILKQLTLGPGANTAQDRFKLIGRVSSAAVTGTWTPIVDGATVCFSDQNAAGPHTGDSIPLLPQAYNGSGTEGWVSSPNGTVHKYIDNVLPRRVKAVFKVLPSEIFFRVVVRNLDGTYGTISPVGDRPPTATVYFQTTGSKGCATTTFVTADCVQNLAVTILSCTQ